MRHILAVLATLFSLLALDAHAQRYAVISLIGDRMQIAYARGVEGQPVDRIDRRYLPLDDTALDRAALLAANDKLRELVPSSEPVLLQAFDRTLFDTGGGTASIIEWVRQTVKDQKGAKVTRALLITKATYDGIPALQKPFVGSGTLGTRCLSGRGNRKRSRGILGRSRIGALLDLGSPALPRLRDHEPDRDADGDDPDQEDDSAPTVDRR